MLDERERSRAVPFYFVAEFVPVECLAQFGKHWSSEVGKRVRSLSARRAGSSVILSGGSHRLNGQSLSLIVSRRGRLSYRQIGVVMPGSTCPQCGQLIEFEFKPNEKDTKLECARCNEHFTLKHVIHGWDTFRGSTGIVLFSRGQTSGEVKRLADGCHHWWIYGGQCQGKEATEELALQRSWQVFEAKCLGCDIPPRTTESIIER